MYFYAYENMLSVLNTEAPDKEGLSTKYCDIFPHTEA